MKSLLPWLSLRAKSCNPLPQPKAGDMRHHGVRCLSVRRVSAKPAQQKSNLKTIPVQQDSKNTANDNSSKSERSGKVKTAAIRINQLRHGKLFDTVTDSINVDPRVLREACKCSKCVDPSDKQRNLRFTDIPQDVEVQRCNLEEDGSYTIHWKNDISGFENHLSRYTRRDLARLNVRFPVPEWEIFQRPLKLWNRSNFQIPESTVSFHKYMSDSHSLARVLHLLWRDGLVFIDGVPETESAVGEIAQRIGPLRNTFYGSTWDVRSVPQAKNVAYTSKYLGFHMDLLYMKEPPGFQLLHCLQNTCSGGESRFADTINAADQLISSNGVDAYETLTQTVVTYEYLNDGYFYNDSKPVFKPLDRQPTRNHLNAQNPVQLGRLQRVYWSPPFVGTALGNVKLDRLPKSLEMANKFAIALDSPEAVIETKLPPGTCAIFDNLRVVHARDAFDLNSGHRWLRGAYLDFQDFYTKAVAMAREMPLVNEY